MMSCLTVSLHSAELHKNHFDQLYDWYSEKLVSEEAEMPENIYKALENQIAGLNTCQMRHSIIKIFTADNYEKLVKWNKNGLPSIKCLADFYTRHNCNVILGNLFQPYFIHCTFCSIQFIFFDDFCATIYAVRFDGTF